MNYQFKDPKLLNQAYTHSSCAYMNGGEHNERLEFLGDAVLGLLVAEAVMASKPHATEGELSRLRAAYVCADHLTQIAVAELSLNEKLQTRLAENQPFPNGLLADALEALIGAIYLDGGLDRAREFISKYILSISPMGSDNKTLLQEMTQARGLGLPEYRLLEALGPEHSRSFLVRASAGIYSSSAYGNSKKEAEKNAARGLIEILGGVA